MAITNISLYQDNCVGDSNIIPIHSPVVFICDVTFNTTTPEAIYVDLIDENAAVLSTYRLIPFRDRSATIRQFMFVANDAVKEFMPAFDDYVQLSDVLEFCENITLNLTLKFYDIDNVSINFSKAFTFAHGCRQMSEYPNLFEQFANDNDTYFGAKDEYVYLYWYNDDISNYISTDPYIETDEYALDYDDEQFEDYDNELFTILTTS